MGIDTRRGRLRCALTSTLLGVALGCANDDRRAEFDPTWQPTAPGPAAEDDDGEGTDTSSAGDESSSEGSGGDAVDDAHDDAADDANDSAPATDDGTPADDGDTGSGDPVLDACLDVATNECETCACNLCLDPLYACQQDPGCVAMRDCAEQAGCAGTECAEPCGAVIEMYGGYFGDSAALALALSECLEPACPVCF